jgi:hypothetical protein
MFDSRRYQIFCEVVGLERGPLSLVSTMEELLERKSSGFGLESREYCRGDTLRWPRHALYPQKLVLTRPTNGGRSVGIVRLRTRAKEFSFRFSISSLCLWGVRDSVVAKELCYKPESRGFDYRWSEFFNLPNPSGRTRPWGLLSL